MYEKENERPEPLPRNCRLKRAGLMYVTWPIPFTSSISHSPRRLLHSSKRKSMYGLCSTCPYVSTSCRLVRLSLGIDGKQSGSSTVSNTRNSATTSVERVASLSRRVRTRRETH